MKYSKISLQGVILIGYSEMLKPYTNQIHQACLSSEYCAHQHWTTAHKPQLTEARTHAYSETNRWFFVIPKSSSYSK